MPTEDLRRWWRLARIVFRERIPLTARAWRSALLFALPLDLVIGLLVWRLPGLF